MYFDYLKIFVQLFCIYGIGESLKFIDKNETDPDLVVQCNEGLVQGSRKQTFRKQVEYFAYQGIPYAEPPVDDLRFKDPIPIRSWQNLTLDATEERDGCLGSPLIASTSLADPSINTSEDCLYLNIYVPKTGNGNLLPVIVWLHGGAFITGSSSFTVFGPDYYLENEVVVVTLNYRLAIFGFLSTGDLECPGNMGIKDQHLAIKWTKDNIKNFGGNPEAITLSGQSAGSVSAYYHMLSPRSKGLFRAVIAQSGTALNPWAHQKDPREVAFLAGYLLGIVTQDSKKLVDNMRQIDAKKIQAMGDMIFIMYAGASLGQEFGFGPVFEPEYPGAYITAESYTPCRKGNFMRVPLMAGVTSQESGLYQDIIRIVVPFRALMDNLQLSLFFKTFNFDSMSMKNKAIQAVKNKYLESGTFAGSNIQELAKYCTDDFFVRSAVKTAQFLSPYIPVYFYQISYMGPSGLNSRSIKQRLVNGTSHTEELFYIWRRDDKPVLTPEDGAFIDILSTLWSNFVKYNNPTPSTDSNLNNIIWDPVNTSEVNYLKIEQPLTMKNKVDFIDMDFWDKVIEKYARKPYITY